jgi:hypothetical protein
MSGPGENVGFVVELGKAVGLLGEDGTVQSDWLASPTAQSKALGAQRIAHLRKALATLFGTPIPPSGVPPLALGNGGATVPAGTWYSPGTDSPVSLVLGGDPDAPRLIGVGGRLSTPAIDLLLQGWAGGTAPGEIVIPPTDARLAPQLLGRASLKVGAGPLGSIDLAAAVSTSGLEAAVLSLTDSTGHAATPLDLTAVGTPASLLQGIRLALFCVRALIRYEAQQGNPTAQQLVDHLLPLLGSTDDGAQPNPIPPFPLAALDGDTAPLLEWAAALFPGPGARGKPTKDPIAATLGHLQALLGVANPPQPDDEWRVWGDDASVGGRAGFYADGDATRLTLGTCGERTADVDGVRMTFEVRAPIALASLADASIRGAGGLDVRVTIASLSPTPGALLVPVDLGAQLGAPELAGMGIARAVISLRQDAQVGVLADFALELSLPDASAGAVLGVDSPLIVPAGAALLAGLPQGSPSVGQILGDLFASLPLDEWILASETSGCGPVVAGVGTLATRFQGVGPGALVALKFGTTLTATLEIGDKGGTPGLWFVPGNTAGAPIRLEGAVVGAVAQSGAAGELTARLVSPLFDPLPVKPALELALGAKGDLELSLLLVDGNGNPSMRWRLLPYKAPTIEDLLRAAIPLLLWPFRDAPELKAPLTSDGLCLGRLLEVAGLGTWNGTTFTPADPTALAALTPLSALLGLVGELVTRATASWIPTGPVEWKGYSQNGRLGVTVRPTGGKPLLDEDNFSLGYQGLDIDLLTQGQGGLSFAPTVHLKALAVDAHGKNGAPLLAAGPISLGGAGLSAGASAGSGGFALDGVALTLHGIELPLGGGGGMASQLLPAGESPGFDFTVAWANSTLAVDVSGKPSAWFAIDRQFGPLNVERVGVEVRPKAELAVLVDGSFSLAGIRVQPDGLGIVLPLKALTDPDDWDFALRGLGLSYNQGGISVSGLFRNNNGDYQGAALVRAFSYQLGAIGAYKSLPDGPSLFLFAALAAPLGGPPWFFVTGVAGGFGYNRALRVPDSVDGVAKLPFFGLMKGDLDLGQIATIGSVLDTYLQPQRNTLWLAGGVTFTSFALIKGQALLYVVIGPHFELGLMALCGFQVQKIVNVELALKARFTTEGGDPNLLVMGGLTDKSWLLGGSCKLHGGFALQVWFGSGDCVLTVGGYSPAFRKPAHYPMVDRIGFRWGLSDAIVLKGDAYFALTPREVMGGSHFDVTGHWGPLSAGFYCWFDALVGWDPFYFVASLDIGVWGKVSTFLGDIGFELGVHLKVHGPPVGGIATIDLAILSIDIPFGSQSLPGSDPLPVGAFVSRMLEMRLPQAAEDDEHLQLPPRAVLDAQGEVVEHGLLLVDVRRGLLSEDGSSADGSTAKPYRLVPEFELVLRTRVPLASAGPIFTTFQNVFDSVPAPDQEPLHFHPCRRGNLTSELSATYAGPPLGAKPVSSAWVEPLPEALFGEGPDAADDERTRPRTAGIRVDGTAQPVVALAGDHSLGQRLSQGADVLPLPLGSRGRPLAGISAQLGVPQRLTVDDLQKQPGGMTLWTRLAQPPRVGSRLSRMIEPGALPAPGGGPVPPPVSAEARPVRALVKALVPLARPILPPPARTTVVGFDAVTRVPAPRPVVRPPALAGVALRIAPFARGRPGRARTVRTGQQAASLQTLDRMSRELLDPGTTLRAGHALVVHVDGRLRKPALLALTGDQPLRVVALGPYGRLLWDQAAGAGGQTLAVAEDVRQLVLFALGTPVVVDERGGGRPGTGSTTTPTSPTTSPTTSPRTGTISRAAAASTGGGTTPAPAVAAPTVAGFDVDTLLVSTDDRCAVGPGCVVALRKGRPLDRRPGRITGAELLADAQRIEVTFAVPADASVLLLEIAAPPSAVGATPLSKSVAWSATVPLSAPQAVAGTDRAALLFDLPTLRGGAGAGATTFRVVVDASAGYRVRGVAVRPGSAVDLRAAMAASPRWDAMPDWALRTAGATLVRLAMDPGVAPPGTHSLSVTREVATTTRTEDA